MAQFQEVPQLHATTTGPGGVTMEAGGVITGPGSATTVAAPEGPVGGIITEVVGIGFSVVKQIQYLILRTQYYH